MLWPALEMSEQGCLQWLVNWHQWEVSSYDRVPRDRHGYRKRNSEPLSPFSSMKLFFFLRTAQLQRLCEYSGTVKPSSDFVKNSSEVDFIVFSWRIHPSPPTPQLTSTKPHAHQVLPLSSALKWSESKSPPGGKHHEETRQHSNRTSSPMKITFAMGMCPLTESVFSFSFWQAVLLIF